MSVSGELRYLGSPGPEKPATKPYHPPPQVVDRKQQPSPEPGNHRAVVALRCQTRLQQDPFLDPEIGHRLEKRLTHRREAQAEQGGRVEGDVAALEVLAGDLCFGLLQQLPAKPIVGDCHCAVERLVRIGSGAFRALRNDDTGAASGLAHGGGVVHPVPLHEPGEHIARLVTHKAVIAALLRDDGEVPIRAAVEGTGSAVVGAGALQRHGLSDQPDDIGAVAHLLDGLVRDHAHAENSTMVTPVPP